MFEKYKVNLIFYTFKIEDYELCYVTLKSNLACEQAPT